MQLYIIGTQGVTGEGIFFQVKYCTKLYKKAIKALFKVDKKLCLSDIPEKFHGKAEYTIDDFNELLNIFADAQEKYIFLKEIEISD